MRARWAVFGLLLAGTPLAAQTPTLSPPSNRGGGAVMTPESQAIRSAATLEQRRDYAGAERVLREFLGESPAASGAIFALERVLRAQDRTRDVLPFIDKLLEVDPKSANIRSMKLRLLVELDSYPEVQAEAERWMRADPESQQPYLELGRVLEREVGIDRMIALLRSGRQRLGNPSAFALELGDALVKQGQMEAAAREWGLIASDPSQTSALLRRVPSLAADGGKVARALIEVLDAEPTTPERRSAAVRIAIEVKLPVVALRVAPKISSALEPPQRRAFLDDVARRADDQRLPAVAMWAYDAQRETASDDADLRRIEGRLVAAALAVGDTVRAVQAEGRLVALLPTGSTERRRILAQKIRQQAPRAEAEELRREVEAFRREFPDAPEVDELASAVAMALQSQGRADAAGEMLLDVRGPRSAVERGYLFLQQGKIDSASVALMQSVNDLPPQEATAVIQLVSLLGKVSEPGAQALAKAAALAHRGSAKPAAEGLLADAAKLSATDRAPLLAEAARMADDAAERELAGRIRSQIVSEHADSAEMPEAAFALARWQAETDRKDEAIRVLENLIVKRPNSAVVPAARRELERLKGSAEGNRP